jgi:alkylation response protein AidB-like acyl-CoA dehydrogenase
MSSATQKPQVVDYELSPELVAFRDQVRDYANTHLGKAAEWDAEVKFPRSAVEAAAKLGLSDAQVKAIVAGEVAADHGA